MRDEEENVMPVKTCVELEKLTFAGFWLRERAKSASASTGWGRSCCEPRNGGSLAEDVDQAEWPAPNIRAFELTARERKSRASDVDGKMNVVSIKL
jgi:hypothetical protein